MGIVLGYTGLVLCLAPMVLAAVTTRGWARPQSLVPYLAWGAPMVISVTVMAVWIFWGARLQWPERGLPAWLGWSLVGLGAVCVVVQLLDWLFQRKREADEPPSDYVPRRMA